MQWSLTAHPYPDKGDTLNILLVVIGIENSCYHNANLDRNRDAECVVVVVVVVVFFFLSRWGFRRRVINPTFPKV